MKRANRYTVGEYCKYGKIKRIDTSHEPGFIWIDTDRSGWVRLGTEELT